MKRGLFLTLTVTLCSALYAQEMLTREEAQSIFAQYNPELLARAQGNEQLDQLVQDMIASYTGQGLPNTLENRYTLIALARNFENSIALHEITRQYQQAVLYSQLGGATAESVRVAAKTDLQTIYSRIWAVSVQVKEDLLSAYKHARKQALRAADTNQAQQFERASQALSADLKKLNTQVGPQLLALVQDALSAAEQKAHQALQADNLQPKTKHKKPVAE